MSYTPLDVQGSFFQLDLMGKEIGRLLSLSERTQSVLAATLENEARKVDVMVVDLEELSDPQRIRTKNEEETEEEKKKKNKNKKSTLTINTNKINILTSDTYMGKREFCKGNFIDIIN